MGATKRGPASVPAQAHYHVVFNDGPAQDHWTFIGRPEAGRQADWWNSKPRNAASIATIRECALPEESCQAWRRSQSCTSCVGRPS